MHVDCDVEELRRRDTKGLYAGQARGSVGGLAGVSAPCEPPADPELHFDTGCIDADAAIDGIVERLRAAVILPKGTA